MNLDCIHARDVGLGDKAECAIGRYYRPTGEVCLQACRERVRGKVLKIAETPRERSRNWQPPAAGLGDTVERVLDATGIGPAYKRAVLRVTGRPCGCGRRRNRLNRLWPYKEAAS
jgi:hypothetical protein